MESSDLDTEEVQQLHQTVFTAARDGDVHAIQSALSGLPPELVSHVLHRYATHADERMTPLAVAAFRGHSGVVKLLVEGYGVDIDHMDSTGTDRTVTTTALISAVNGSHMDVVYYLVHKGCNVNLADSRGQTALFYTVNDSRTNTAIFLVQNGAAVNAINAYEETALMLACWEKNDRLVQYLIEKGADVKLRCKTHYTALHFAAMNNAVRCMKLLVKGGATNTKAKDGRTPLFDAAVSRHVEIVDLMVQLPSTSQEDRITALEVLGASMATVNLPQAFLYLSRAMEERWRDPSNPVLKPHSPLLLLSDRMESCTVEELRARESQSDELQLECLACLQRTLGPYAKETKEMYHVCQRSLMDARRFHDAMELRLQYWRQFQFADAESNGDHLLEVCQEMARVLATAAISPKFVHVRENFDKAIAGMLRWTETLAVNIKVLGKFIYPCFQLLLFGCKAAQEEVEMVKCEEMIIVVMKFLPLFHCIRGFQILHLFLSLPFIISPELPHLPIVQLVDMMLSCGAGVHAKDGDGNTPLHLVLSHDVEDDPETKIRIIQLLLKDSVQLFTRNKNGRTPLDLAVHPLVKSAIRAILPPSLQSLVALAILENKIPYKSKVPPNVADFIEMH